MSIFVCVCMSVSGVCIFVRICMSVSLRLYMYVCLYLSVSVSVSMHMSVYQCVYACDIYTQVELYAYSKSPILDTVDIR